MAGPGPDPVALDCPRCGVSTAVPACHHLELSGAPAVRQALLEDSLQRVACPACGTPVRPEPRLTCADTSRGWWLAAFPRDQVDAWQALEADAARAQAELLAKGQAPTPTPTHARIVFGWPALREKLVVLEAGLDDAALEKLKLLLMRDMQEPPLPLGAELRLTAVSVDGAEFTIAVLDRRGQPLESLSVPRELLDEILADPQGWAALDTALRAGWFTDLQRLTRGPGHGPQQGQ